jgi:hypothetical protein
MTEGPSTAVLLRFQRNKILAQDDIWVYEFTDH